MAIAKWGDAAPLPSGAALRAAGFSGVFGYVGTPDLVKNLTRSSYLDMVDNGLALIGIFERFATDIDGGEAAGAANADAAINDMMSMGIPATTPVGCAADEHLTAARIPLAVAYQTGFYHRVKDRGWLGRVMGYGFSEYTRAIWSAGVAEILWQCGAQAELWPPVHFWQDNTGTDIVAGQAVDRDWQLLPIPSAQEDDMAVQTFSFDPTGVKDASGNVSARRHVFGTETNSMSALVSAAWCWVKSGWGPIQSVRIIAIGDALSPGGPARYLADQTWTNVRPDAERCLMTAPDGTDQFSVEIMSEYQYTITLATKPK